MVPFYFIFYFLMFLMEEITGNPPSASPHFLNGKQGKPSALITRPNPLETLSEAQQYQHFRWPGT
jgi:hypothetical protein